MLSTKNYEMFQTHSSNRNLVEKNIRDLMNSISKENLLHLRPILVNGNMEVIDGQHRLEAAKRLDIEIYYQVDESLKTEDIGLLNQNQMKWSLPDYLNFHRSQMKDPYMRLYRFMEKNGVTFNIAISLLGMDLTGRTTVLFKSGKMPPISLETEIEALTKLKFLREVIQVVSDKTIGPKAYLYGANFARAFGIFLNVKSVDFSIFKKKLEMRLDFLRPCTRRSDYLKMFRDIYNFRNSNPISDLNAREN